MHAPLQQNKLISRVFVEDESQSASIDDVDEIKANDIAETSPEETRSNIQTANADERKVDQEESPQNFAGREKITTL